MLDEAAISKQLGSALYGSLLQTVEITAPVFRADAAAIRVSNTSATSLSSYMNTYQLGLESDTALALVAWSDQQDSVFEFIYKTPNLPDEAFRLPDITNNWATDRNRLFRPFDLIATVTDSLCLPSQVTESLWFLAVYIRCTPNNPFDSQDVEHLNRLKTPMSQTVKRGYELEHHASTSTHVFNPHGLPHPASDSELIDRLSQTERLVLNHLRLQATERQIASTMQRSPHTIHVHVKNIYRKLRVTSRRRLLDLFAHPLPHH